MKAEPEAAALWLLINHPAGNIALAQQDMENIAALKEAMPFTPLRVFVTGEDIGVREAVL